MKKDNLDILSNIKRVKVPDSLCHKIEMRINKSRENIVPLYRVGIAASLVIGLMLSQLYVLENFSYRKENSHKETELVQLNNNSLYYE